MQPPASRRRPLRVSEKAAAVAAPAPARSRRNHPTSHRGVTRGNSPPAWRAPRTPRGFRCGRGPRRGSFAAGSAGAQSVGGGRGGHGGWPAPAGDRCTGRQQGAPTKSARSAFGAQADRSSGSAPAGSTAAGASPPQSSSAAAAGRSRRQATAMPAGLVGNRLVARSAPFPRVRKQTRGGACCAGGGDSNVASIDSIRIPAAVEQASCLKAEPK